MLKPIAGWLAVCGLAIVTLPIAGCGTRPAAPRSGPPVQIGVNSDITWGIPTSGVEKEVGLIASAGVRWVRVSVDLSDAEYHREGQLEPLYMLQIDRAVRAARHAHLNVLMELDRTPFWASADPRRRIGQTGPEWNPYWRYRNFSDYASVASDVVRRYGRMGVHAYELWNEPNFPHFWPSGTDPRAYAALLKASYPAVKKADPKATVVMGGLSNLGSYAFLQGMYASGARGYYDVANFHVYPQGDPHDCLTLSDGRMWPGSLCLLQGLRQVMLQNHDLAPVWVTEFGWSTCGHGDQCVSLSTQARYIEEAFKVLDTAPYEWVQNAFLYEMHDLFSTGPWNRNLPILTKSYIPKPGYYALRAVATRSGALSDRAR